MDKYTVVQLRDLFGMQIQEWQILINQDRK